MVLVCDEQNVAPGAAWIRGNLRDAIEHGALKVELQHHTQAACQSGIERNWEIQAEHAPLLDQIFQRRQRLPFAGFRWSCVRGSLGAEGPLHGRILVEERQENDNAFDD